MKVIHLHQTEKEQIALAVENNRQAQQNIYAAFSPKMLSVCRMYIKDLQHAEDVMISAFMKVFLNLKNYQFNGSFEGWIRRIMINESISFLRAQKKISYLEDEKFSSVENQNKVEFSENYSIEQIQNLIDNLPNGCKMVFNLYAIEGFKHSEIAKMLSISESTSKSQLTHARKLLQKNYLKLNEVENGTE